MHILETRQWGSEKTRAMKNKNFKIFENGRNCGKRCDIALNKKELNEKVKYLEGLANKVSTSKYFIVVLALEELKNIYDQKQRLYKEMKKLDSLTVIKTYNLKDNENEMMHPIIKEYRTYNDAFLKTIKRAAEVIKELSDPKEEAQNSKLKGFQSKIKQVRGGGENEEESIGDLTELDNSKPKSKKRRS